MIGLRTFSPPSKEPRTFQPWLPPLRTSSPRRPHHPPRSLVSTGFYHLFSEVTPPCFRQMRWWLTSEALDVTVRVKESHGLPSLSLTQVSYKPGNSEPDMARPWKSKVLLRESSVYLDFPRATRTSPRPPELTLATHRSAVQGGCHSYPKLFKYSYLNLDL